MNLSVIINEIWAQILYHFENIILISRYGANVDPPGVHSLLCRHAPGLASRHHAVWTTASSALWRRQEFQPLRSHPVWYALMASYHTAVLSSHGVGASPHMGCYGSLHGGGLLFTGFLQRTWFCRRTVCHLKKAKHSMLTESNIPAVGIWVPRPAERFCDLFHQGTGSQNFTALWWWSRDEVPRPAAQHDHAEIQCRSLWRELFGCLWRLEHVTTPFIGFITALHGMQTRSYDEIYVRPSVCLSVKRVHCDKTEERYV